LIVLCVCRINLIKMSNTAKIIKAEIADVGPLLNLSRKTFYEAFLHMNDPLNMDTYASAAFTEQRFKQELNNPDSEFYFAIVEDKLAGYLKINYKNAQTELKDPVALEVERIYVLGQYQGQQIGKQLLSFAVQKAINAKLEYVWLGVWEHNIKAISFYGSKGFEQFGSHSFMLGNDKQTDVLMKKKI
jgi:ribosomal protein S18 acetylase RimI-like enzyme